MAALTALGAGANPIYLGAELPDKELLNSVERAGAAALALSLVTLSQNRAAQTVRATRSGLTHDVHLWLGGATASALEPGDRVECIDSLEAFEQRVALLGFERTNGR
jgi:hypothetical protein